MLFLPNVTLVCVDCVNVLSAEKAIAECTDKCTFGSVKLLTSLKTKSKHAVRIKSIKSTQQYSCFMIKDLNDYIDTEYALVVQHDGYILDYSCWTDEFLKYDYIGAPWWRSHAYNVGNGGFSLRSKRLLHILANDTRMSARHPEDECICIGHRNPLECEYGIRFAPEDLAHRFSFERNPKYNESEYRAFGFHGFHTYTAEKAQEICRKVSKTG